MIIIILHAILDLNDMERVKLFIEGNLIVKYGYKMGRGKISLQQKKEDFEYEKLIEGDYVYNGETGDIALSGSVTFLRKGGEDGCL